MTDKRLLIATTNPGKIREIERVLSGYGIAVLSPLDLDRQPPEFPEKGETFCENAAGKAEHWSGFSGLACLADDSGLCVDALEGAPGVYSARFAGEPPDDGRNNAQLLERLQGIPDSERGAAFICCLALAAPGAPTRTFTGQVRGVILAAPRGEKGFGYDPLFYYPPLGRTFAQLNPAYKSRVSHRGKALEQFSAWLRQTPPA